ncbi:hypothetical protein PVL29_024670 [Vitis rotundifolia]|uniref:Transposase MuDR plant domain-containing protein n=1 Tax=Vitis rotundifolia TaxID=103349 RepID=A0AA39D9D3_VITRO|nr:hypothetical protein PVL29_024670 [Vitis rotundifolia]
MLFQLGYKDCMSYYYANKNGELSWCLTDGNVLEMCSSLSKDGGVEVFVKHREVLHIAQGEIGSSNVCNQLGESVCEGEDYTTNVEPKPNVDQTPQYEDKGGLDYEEAERDSFGDSDFIDDEYPVSDDDDLYDNYVDANEEWVGVKGKEDKEKGVEGEYTIMNDVEDEKNISCYEDAIKNGRNVKFVKNEKDKVRVVCSKGCPWVVYVAEVRDEKKFQVRTYNGQHTCSRVLKNDNVTLRYLCNKYVDHFRNNPKLSIGAFMNIVRTSLACEVSPSQAYRTKRKTLKQIQGTYVDQYVKLPDYCAEMRRTNSGSTVILKTELVEDKGLLPAIEKLLPNSKHKYCL